MKQSIRSIKTNGYYVYSHQTPDKMVYFGMSKQQPYKRWRPCAYKFSLHSYIEKYGWKNIKHAVIQDGLTKEQALKIEDWLIRKAKADGFCINEYNSGGESRPKVNKKRIYLSKEEKLARRRERNKEPKQKLYNNMKSKERRSTKVGKIYNRVNAYNQAHPDRKLITPAEAKEMYELTGYIPDFIKKVDLF